MEDTCVSKLMFGVGGGRRGVAGGQKLGGGGGQELGGPGREIMEPEVER